MGEEALNWKSSTDRDPWHALQRLIRDIWKRLGLWLIVLVALVALTGFTEGLTMSLMVPLLHSLELGPAGGQGGFSQTMAEVLNSLGLEISLGPVLLAMGALAVLQGVFALGQGWIAARLTTRYVESLRLDLFRCYFAAPLSFFVRHRQSDLFHALMTECERTGSGLSLFTQLASGATVATIYVSLAFLISWKAAATLLAGVTILFLMIRPLVRLGAKIGREVTEASAAVQSDATEFLAAAKLVKSTATESTASAQLETTHGRLNRAKFRSRMHPAVLRVTLETSGILLLCGVLGVGVLHLGIPIAEIFVVVVLFVRLYPKLSQLQQNLHVLYSVVPAFERTEMLREEADEVREQPAAGQEKGAFLSGPPRVEVVGLGAAYEGREVLHGVDMEIKPGEVVGLVGVSGSGKSTLMDCLLRLVPWTRGEIVVNGRSLTTIPLGAWRQSIGYVPQESILFHGSVRQNLLWGRTGDSESEMIAAAKLAEAHDFILQMPHGYDSVIGDRGVRMSGGQRQRLALARALIGSPHLLMLDEAFSQLDSETEVGIVKTVLRLRGRATMIIIAHRLAALRGVDRIFVLGDGRVVECGTWEDLVDNGVDFANMWQLQQ